MALLTKKMLTHPVIPNICVATAPSSAPPVMSARGAIASDNIPIGTAERSSAPNDTAPKVPTSAASTCAAPIGEIGEIQPDEHSARSAGDPHKSVSEQRNRKPAPRASQGFAVRSILGAPFFHNVHVDRSMVSGRECSNLTRNLKLGNPL